MKNELLEFYKSISMISKVYHSDIRGVYHTVSWVSLFEFGDGEKLGVSSGGIWTIENKNGLYLLDVPKNYLYCVSMLEFPVQFIVLEILKKIKNIVEEDSIYTLFPFYEILEFTLGNMNDDYWFELAMTWYNTLKNWEKIRLESFLLAICENKKFSQKNRQTAYKEIKCIQKMKK